MTQDLGLAHARQSDRRTPLQTAETGLDRRHRRQVDARLARAVDLEEQRLLELQAAMAVHGVRRRGGRGGAVRPAEISRMAHHSTSGSARASASMSASLVSSLAATSRMSSTPAPSPNSRA